MYLSLRIPIRIPETVTVAVVGAIVLLAGCVSQPAAVDYYMRTEYQISARNADPIRPALDVIVLGGGHGYRSASYGGSNLWGRVRSFDG